MNSIHSSKTSPPELTPFVPPGSTGSEPTESGKSFVEMLVPHLVAATFILAAITVTPSSLWQSCVAVVFPVLKPMVVPILLATGVCSLIAYPLLWWICDRSSNAYYQGTVRDAKRAARDRKWLNKAA